MRSRLRTTLALTALALSSPAAAQVDLSEGLFVSVKGEFTGRGFIARSVGLAEEPVESIRGPMEAADETARSVSIGAFEASLAAGSKVQDEEGHVVPLGELHHGQTIKITFEPRDLNDAKAPLIVDKVKRRAEASEFVRLEGRVEALLPSGSHESRLRVLGVVVLANVDTQWEGIRPPQFAGAVAVVDDDKRRPANALRLGKAGWFSGEVVAEFREGQDDDLTNLLQDSSQRARLRSSLEWTLPSTDVISATAELKLIRDWVLVDDSNTRADSSEALIGETWIQFSGIMTKHGSLQVGRLYWDDEREWWFRRDMDTIKFSFQWAHWSLAAALSQQLADPEVDLQEVRHLLLEAHWTPVGRHRLTLYALDRTDSYRYASAQGPSVPRAFEPRHYGFHAEGKGKKLWSYWADAAIVRGADQGEALEGNAFDVGAQLTWDTIVQPTLVLGYAMGSGDDDLYDTTRANFRQTGLEENNGKWNGVTNFRYYGEVFRPELANIHIRTVGFGLHLPDDWSMDFIWHDYELDEIAPEVIGSSAGHRRRLNLLSKRLGEEWDVVVGYEGLEHWEFEMSLGTFKPGDAWLGPLDNATSVYFKTKYIF